MENIARIHDVGHPRRDSKIDQKCTVEIGHFNGRIIFMSMYNDIAWEENGNTKNVFRILLKFRSTLAGSLAVVGHSWDLNQKRNGARLVLINQTEIGIERQE